MPDQAAVQCTRCGRELPTQEGSDGRHEVALEVCLRCAREWNRELQQALDGVCGGCQEGEGG